MDDKGVYAIARSIWENPTFDNEPYTQREAWMWLIGAAAWSERRVRGNGGQVILGRGEFCFSVRFLEERWQWSKSRVARFLKTLEKRDMIRDAKRDNSQVYFIVKYNDFQVVGLPKRDSKRDTPRDASGTAAGQQRDKEETLETLEEGKRKKEAPAAPPSKPTVVSKLPDWLPLEPWAAFLEVRRKKRATPTQHALDLLLRDLDRWRQLGHDPTEIINYSIKGNYTGLFEPKAGANGKRDRPSQHENFAAGAFDAAKDFDASR